MPVVPFIIKGTVSLGGTNYQGAKVWAINLSTGKLYNSVAGVTYFYTQSNGRYVLEVANVSSSVAAGNVVRVFCKVGDIETYADVTVVATAGGATQNFTLTRKSGLTDAIKDTRNSDGTGGLLHDQIVKSCKDAMN